MTITAAMLYDLVQCPHRVSMDLFPGEAKPDAVSPFVKLLWERGSAHEEAVIAGLSVAFVDLSGARGEEKARLTEEAMAARQPLIYSGRISAGDLLGEPDLLRWEGSGYVAGDIKSGAGEEGGSDDADGKPKKHYAVQLALYTDILEQKSSSAGRRAFVWDVEGQEVNYDFAAPYDTRNPRTLWADYQEALGLARAIFGREIQTKPAYSSGDCKLCVWYSACIGKLEADNDLTLIPELGRSKRDAMADRVTTIRAFADSEVEGWVSGRKTAFAGIGVDTVRKLHARAQLLSVDGGGRPYLREPVELPKAEREVFFDIEVDPMRDLCYLHGFLERRDGRNESENFVGIFAETPDADGEHKAFAAAWTHLQSLQPCGLYFYSRYERTIYRKLRAKYPDVCTEAELEAAFLPPDAVDLYTDVVKRATEWPARDYSIKTLATYLGFHWRDAAPSGAASIEWFDRWAKGGDPAVRQRILEYNEDDCRATRVLLDGVRALKRM